MPRSSKGAPSLPATTTDPLVPRLARVERVVRETADVVTLYLGGAGETVFRPGQFGMVYLFGVGEVPLSYSGDPARPAEVTHTVRAVGTVTRPLAALRRGAMVGVRGPYGSAWPLAEAGAQDVLVIAGGIGVAPLRPVIHHVLRHRQVYGRIVLLYGARTAADLLYRRDLERWRTRFDVEVRVIVDQPARGWRGDVGVVTSLLGATRFDPVDTVAMICGPEVMMRFAARELRKIGVANANVWLSLERNMQCAVGWCGHCQLGPAFICKDGPIFPLDRVTPFLGHREF
jgi:NAD(P)H-flavin reductase